LRCGASIDLSFITIVGYNPTDGGSGSTGVGVKYGLFGVDAYAGGPHVDDWNAGGGFGAQLYLPIISGVVTPFVEVGGYYHSKDKLGTVSVPSMTLVNEQSGKDSWKLTGGGGLSFQIPVPADIGVRGAFVNVGYNTAKGFNTGLGVTF
jgi:hypothetical protein